MYGEREQSSLTPLYPWSMLGKVQPEMDTSQHPNGNHPETGLGESSTETESEGYGLIGWMIILLSFILVLVTFPFSIWSCVKIVQEYERAVIFRLGRVNRSGAKGPGLFWILPCTDHFCRIDLRTISFSVPPQEHHLYNATKDWGIKVERVEIKDVKLPQSLQRAMAAEAEAGREARAKVISAEGEMNASQALKEAALVMSESPAAMQLRYLQTLSTISAEKNSTIIFPIPVDFLTMLAKK
ncbi:stomatin-like isoform X5 [Lissotriton helveticus]